MASTFIALIRGVNVLGNNSLPTKDLIRILESTGLKNVRTYIQTGNAVFLANEADAAGLSEKIRAKIQRRLGFAPEVILLRLNELERFINSNPYPGADSNHKALHLMFLTCEPRGIDLTACEKYRSDSEECSLQGRVLYFWAPDGVGRSKLFSRIEKLLGVTGTARNWRSACKLLELAREVEATAPRT